MGSRCLLFVVPESKTDCSKPSSSNASKWKKIDAFVLLPSIIRKNHPKTCELFTKRNIQVLSSGDSPAFQSALESDQLEIVELILLNENRQNLSKNRKTKTETATRLQISVEPSNGDIVSRIFRRNAVLSEISSHDGILNVTDAENVSFMNEILSVRPNIRLRDSEKGSLLHLAAMRDDATLVKMLLEHGVEVNLVDSEGATPLHLASRHGNSRIVQLLLEKGALVNAEQKNGATSLHLAAAGGWLEIYKLLSTNGALITRGKFDGAMLVHAAVRNEQVEILNDLLQLDVDLNTAFDGCTPLYVAAKNGHLIVVKWLLEHGVDVDNLNSKGQSALSVAVKKQCVDMVTTILSYRPDLNCESSKKAFEKVILRYEKNCKSIVELLSQYGFTVRTKNVNNIELMIAAISKNYFDVLKTLLEMGAEVNKTNPNSYRTDEVSALHAAVWKSRSEMVQLLIQYGADVNIGRSTHWPEGSPLYVAVGKSNLELVKVLLTHGAFVVSSDISKAVEVKNSAILETLLPKVANCSAQMFEPALLKAISNADLYAIEVLLRYGAIVNGNAISKAAYVLDAKIMKTLLVKAVDLSTETINLAFLNAVFKSNVEVVKLLLSYGAAVTKDALYKASVANNVELMNTLLLNAGDTLSAEMMNSAFCRAVVNCNLKMVKLLLKFGADINANDNDGSSVVHLASECDMVKFLLVNNAELERKDKMGLTPLYRAAQRGHVAVFNHLLAFGASIDVVDNQQRPALFRVVVSGFKNVFKNFLDAFFQTPEFIVKANVWKIFNESYLKEDRAVYLHYTRNREYFQECSADFERLLIKVKAAKPDFNDAEIILSWHLEEADVFRSDCETEMTCMKTLTIGETVLTFHDILVKHTQQLAGYMRNDTVRQMLKSDDYKQRFPIYASIIQLQIKKGLQRRELLDEGLKICRHLFRDFMTLPLELRERIVNYLTDQNLAVLKYAVTGSVA